MDEECKMLLGSEEEEMQLKENEETLLGVSRILDKPLKEDMILTSRFGVRKCR